ncbi:MAG: hypothetical protein KF718_23685 [Polyangiaceae bacterium]|nr:hypothetical protein [Polyangiaceae bacterium]
MARARSNHPPLPQPALDRNPNPTRLGRVLRWFRPPRRLKLTREGKYFIGITFGVGFAAINTGNNLLYLLLGMLLSLIVVSGVMSEMSLRHLTVVRRLPPRAQVGRPHLVEIEVYNHKTRVPSYAIEIEDLRAGQPADKRCFFLKISPQSAQVAAYRRNPGRRGRDRHIGFRVATRFPFGLFEKSRELSADGDLIIYPAVDPIRLSSDQGGVKLGLDGNLGRGHGDEILGVRPKRDGDDPRDVYWPKSTVPEQEVYRERARETRRDVDLHLDSIHPGDTPDDAWSERFERRIRDLASRSVAHLKRGDTVSLRTSTGERVRAGVTHGADPILRFLALIEPTAASRARTEAPPPNLPRRAPEQPARPAA